VSTAAVACLPGGGPTVTPHYEDDLEIEELLRTLYDAVAKLPLHQRRVVELAYGEGLTHVEMADRLRRPLGTVKTWVRAALQTLREQMSELTEVPAPVQD